MVLSSRIAFHAWHRHVADRENDRGKASSDRADRRAGSGSGLILAAALAACPAAAEIRVAVFNPELSRDGPGLLLRDILTDEDPQIAAAAGLVARARPDAILLLDFDYDHGLVALDAFRDRVAQAGWRFDHLVAFRPNSGWQTGLDPDGDGRTGEPRDAQGYGTYAGQGGMALLSRWPVAETTDFSSFLWRDLPGALIAEDDPGFAEQRLSNTGHWRVTLDHPEEGRVTLLPYHATPPVFDGPEDRNGRRNHDESLFWKAYLDGALPWTPPSDRFVILGAANLDPADGDGRGGAIRALLSDPRLTDPEPRGADGAAMARAEGGANRDHRGDPALDTANWRDDPGPGNLRVDYVLPSSDWQVAGSGILWDRGSGRAGDAFRHGLVWADLAGDR